jgi:hypothetical protein
VRKIPERKGTQLSKKINICFMSYRQTTEVLLNLSNLLELSKHLNVSLYIGLGGKYSGNFLEAIERRVAFYDPTSTSISIFVNESPKARLAWMLSHDSEWIIFVTDDDSFTTNHVLSLIEGANSATDGVMSVVPQLYFMVSGHQGRIYQPSELTQPTASARLAAILNEKFIGLRYYSAIRAHIVKAIFTIFSTRPRYPSYLDQLVVISAAMNGFSTRTKTLSGLFYQIDNWATTSDAIASDLKSYVNPLSVVFHESYMFCDIHRLLSSVEFDSGFFSCFKELGLKMQRRQRDMMSSRLKEISMDNSECAMLCHNTITSFVDSVDKSTKWTDFKCLYEFVDNRLLPVDRICFISNSVRV